MSTPDIPKVSNQDIQNEVQDFSIKKQPNPMKTFSGSMSSNSKLDDTLNKLMKRKNCVSIKLLLQKSQMYLTLCYKHQNVTISELMTAKCQFSSKIGLYFKISQYSHLV